MKVLVSFSFAERLEWNVGPNSVPRSLLERIINEWPGTQNNYSIKIEGDITDVAVKRAILLAKSIGKIPYLSIRPSLAHDYDGPFFNITAKLIYEPCDLEGVEYFILSLSDKIAEMEFYKHADGTREEHLDGRSISKRISLGFIGTSIYGGCKEPMRFELSGSGLFGLNFFELSQRPISKPHVPVYAVSSSVKMPRLLNPLFDDSGKPLAHSVTERCLIGNSILAPAPPLYFDKREVSSMAPFDCAWTAESYGIGGIRYFIVTRKLINFLDQRKVRYTTRPVFLRSDGKIPEIDFLGPIRALIDQ